MLDIGFCRFIIIIGGAGRQVFKFIIINTNTEAGGEGVIYKASYLIIVLLSITSKTNNILSLFSSLYIYSLSKKVLIFVLLLNNSTQFEPCKSLSLSKSLPHPAAIIFDFSLWGLVRIWQFYFSRIPNSMFFFWDSWKFCL